MERLAIIDPAAGAAGDMFLGALVACGAGTEWLQDLPERLGLAGEVAIEIEQVNRCSISATRVRVLVHGEEETPGLRAPHGHGHGPHRHLAELVGRIDAAEVSNTVKERSTRAITMIAAAEARVHGIGVETVSLHEVGAWDAVVDIVGTCEGFERLGVGRITTLPVAVGAGWVRAAHGTLPVPAPATGELLEGLTIHAGGPTTGEALTPTGAALLKVLTNGESPPNWSPSAQGWGAGSRDPEEYPNALRIWLAEPVRESSRVAVITTDLDDLSPEYIEPLRQALMAAGALDVQVWGTQMKKGRPGLRIEAQCAPTAADAVSEAMFRHSTAAGLRMSEADRRVLLRSELKVNVHGRVIRVKLYQGPDGNRCKPEYDDIAAAVRQLGLPAAELARIAIELARNELGIE